MPKLVNWKLCEAPGQEYRAPEIRETMLVGEVHDHPRFPNGSRVQTSDLKKLDWRTMTADTASGSHYELGAPDPEWIAWLQKNGYDSWQKFIGN